MLFFKQNSECFLCFEDNLYTLPIHHEHQHSVFLLCCFTMSSVISIKIPNTKHKLISAALLCFWRVLTAAGCQVGSFSSHSPSRSGEAEQLPWQHKWNGDTGTVSFHASLPQTHWQTPTSSDIRAPFTHSPSSPNEKGLTIFRKPFKASPVQTCQATLTSRYKNSLVDLLSFIPPPSALCSHTCLPTQPR